VLDPVMVATSGDLLLREEAVETLVRVLLPKALLITPNLAEGARLCGTAVAESREAMVDQARRLKAMGPGAVLLKGGHGSGPEAADVLVDDRGVTWFTARRHPTRNTHGTGCTLSSAIAAGLALGKDLVTAVTEAKAYVTDAIIAADGLSVGQGNGPVHHFHRLWPLIGR
jgi:hydroxymethylpyrimidine/phosphomethylpyrimidine kinase